MSITTLVVNLLIASIENTYTDNNIGDEIENLPHLLELIKFKIIKVKFIMRHSPHTGQNATSTGQSVIRTSYDHRGSTQKP